MMKLNTRLSSHPPITMSTPLQFLLLLSLASPLVLLRIGPRLAVRHRTNRYSIIQLAMSRLIVTKKLSGKI